MLFQLKFLNTNLSRIKKDKQILAPNKTKILYYSLNITLTINAYYKNILKFYYYNFKFINYQINLML